MAITFVNGTSGFCNGTSSCVINAPASIQQGDYLLAFLTNDGTASTISAPGGWIALDADNTNPFGMNTFYKVATNSEPASYTFTIPSLSGGGLIVAYRGVSSIDVHGHWVGTNAGAGASAGPLTSTAADRVVVVFGSTNASASWSTPTSYTARTSGPANTVEAAAFELQQSSMGSTGTVNSTFTGAGNVAWGSGMISLQPPGSPPGSPLVMML